MRRHSLGLHTMSSGTSWVVSQLSGRALARAALGREFPVSTLSIMERVPSPAIAHVSSRPPLKFRTVGFPQYGFPLRHHAVRSGAFRHDVPPFSPIPDMPAASHTFTPAFETRVRLPGSPPLCADLWRCSSHLSPEVLAPEELCCLLLPRLATSSASLETSTSFPSTAGYRGGLWHARVLLPGLHTFRTSATVLSRIAAISFRRESGTCAPILPYQRWPSGRGKKPLAPPMLPPISFTWGPNFDGLFVRSRYGPPGCSPPGLIRPRTRGVPSPP